MLVEQMKLLASQEYPKEACGFVVKVGGAMQVVQCSNEHEDPENGWRISSEAEEAVRGLGEIVAVWHSHPDGSAEPSQEDVASCSLGDVPWFIVTWPDVGVKLLDAETVLPLEGREFIHGVLDCYTLVRDYLKTVEGVSLPNYEREDAWWEGDSNLYFDNVFKHADRVPLEDLRPGDVLMMQIRAKKVNHAAVYLGEDKILHHLYGYLSKVDYYSEHYKSRTVFAVRARK